MDEVRGDPQSKSEEVPTYGTRMSPYVKALMRSMGGTLLSHKLTAKQAVRWGLDQPDSVVNLLSEDPELAEAAAKLPAEVLRQTETELRGKYPELPSRIDRRARIVFWEAYEDAAKELSPISLREVSARARLPSWGAYREQLMENPDLLGWFMTPPPEYQLHLREAQELGLSRLMDILELPAKDPKTDKVNPAVLALQLRAWQLVDLRVNGAVAQKTITMSATMGTVPEGGALDVAAIDEKLAQLEQVLAGTSLSLRPAGDAPKPELEVQGEVADDRGDS